MNTPARPFPWLAATAILTLSSDSAPAATPRSERVATRVAERAYARQSIAEARAVRAEARLVAIAPTVPVPPPPRPITVRRMLRAGVPLNGQPPLNGPPPLDGRPPLGGQPLLVGPPSAGPLPSAVAGSTPIRPTAPTAAAPATDQVSADGTRSVLAAAEEPAASTAAREPAGPAVTHPPIELLPTPQPQ
jgi:hypothetical protein